mmetsp:Transcript_149591/g.480093  ORF Transcript_149591/g.480093 Transcript_149591/m.480093 type:complete len:223 (+) Transcript_149591:5299-5967(+)
MVRSVGELRLDQASQRLLSQEGLVCILVHPVLVDARALVAPETDQNVGLVDDLRVGLADTLKDAAEVAQREDVVELRRRRRHVLQDLLVQNHRRLRQLQRRLLDCGIEASKAIPHDGGVDALNALPGGEGDSNASIQGRHTRIDRVAACEWRLHARDELKILDDDFLEVAAALVDEASLDQEFQKSQWLLSAVRIDLGHGEVVDEEPQLLALLWAKDAARAL